MSRSLARGATVVIALGVAISLALPPLAHVTVQTGNPEPGGFAVYTVRVPNESDTASTISIEVEMPPGLDATRYEAKGWAWALEGGVLTIEGGSIGPGEFADFHFQARNPDAPGPLSFAAVQTYDDGETVTWVGAPASDRPASVVEIGSESGAGSEGVVAWVGVVLGTAALALGGTALKRRT